MKKSIKLSDTIVKGQIERASWEEKHDKDGYKFRQETIQMGGETYLAALYKVMGFGEDQTLILEFEQDGNERKVISGINVSVDESWGKSPGKLKKFIEPNDRFILVRGKVTEKRIKNETQLASDEGAAGVSMILIIQGKQYVVPYNFGRKVTLGDEVALVLHGPLQQPYVWKNFTTGMQTRNFRIFYFAYALLIALAYGCWLGYQAGRMDWVVIAIVMAMMGGFLCFAAYTMRWEYVRKKQGLEYINLSKASL